MHEWLPAQPVSLNARMLNRETHEANQLAVGLTVNLSISLMPLRKRFNTARWRGLCAKNIFNRLAITFLQSS